tara:strand:+ start:305 stop:880 length:576 start_codon:yes stop_codon:yes gene_type:complete
MVEHRLKLTAKKLKRLKVDFAFNNNSVLLRGTSLSKGYIFVTIILPIVVFAIIIIGLGIVILAPEFERIVFPKIILFLPLVLLYYGLKNMIKLRQSKKCQVNIMPGMAILTYKNNADLVVPIEKIKELSINIEENESGVIGGIYITNNDLESYLLLSLIDNNVKYLKNDLEYIRSTFLMILNLDKTIANNG